MILKFELSKLKLLQVRTQVGQKWIYNKFLTNLNLWDRGSQMENFMFVPKTVKLYLIFFQTINGTVV